MNRRKSTENFKHLLVSPIIASLIIPLVIIDAWIEFYHQVCFPVYKIPLVNRNNYIKIDRHKLTYLSWPQKLYCMYCGYANGLINYAQEIAGQTEKYWCGIQHQQTPGFIAPQHHTNLEFTEYNNEEAFKKQYPKAKK